MKRNLLTLAAFGVITFGAHAASTGQITISGQVTLVADVSVQGVNNTGLDLTTSTPSSGTKVATVTEKCNNRNGYKIQLTSDNNFVLKGVAGNSETVSYTINYNLVELTLDSGSSSQYTTTVFAKTTGTGHPSDLKVKYTGNPDLGADTYSDTIHVTLVTQ